jgi:hypothetical protein
MYQRRRSEVLRKLDDPLKVLGVFTPRSCMLLAGVYVGGLLCLLAVNGLTLTNTFGLLLLVAVLGLTVAAIEKQTDEHYVWAALRYLTSQRWRYVYSGGYRPPYRLHESELLLLDRERENEGVRREGR